VWVPYEKTPKKEVSIHVYSKVSKYSPIFWSATFPLRSLTSHSKMLLVRVRKPHVVLCMRNVQYCHSTSAFQQHNSFLCSIRSSGLLHPVGQQGYMYVCWKSSVLGMSVHLCTFRVMTHLLKKCVTSPKSFEAKEFDLSQIIPGPLASYSYQWHVHRTFVCSLRLFSLHVVN